MKTALLFPLLLALTGIASGATIFVPDDYPTIQDALDASASGDEIIVRPGTYYGHLYIPSKAITLRSELGAKVTILDGNQLGMCGMSFGTDPANSAVLDGFTITNNNGVHGSGIICCDNAIIRNNIITGNTASCCGGGIKTWSDIGASALIVNNLIYDNHVDHAGGGIRCQGTSKPIILNNTIFGNTAGNQGGGIEHRKDSNAEVINTILWNNSAPSGPEIYDTSSVPISVTYCDVQGGWPGVGNKDADPLFYDPVVGDFHLTYDSPCRGWGLNSTVLPDTDFEGDPRVIGIPDIGADEFQFHLYSVCDIVPGGSANIRVVGWPDMYAWLLKGSGIRNPALQTKYGEYYLEKPVRTYSLGVIPSNGIFDLPVTIPTQWTSGEVYPFQGFVGHPQWPSSRLTNLMVVTVE